MKYLPGIGILTIFARNMKNAGMTDEEIAAKMKKRLNLERFDPDTLNEEDRQRHKALSDFLRTLEVDASK